MLALSLAGCSFTQANQKTLEQQSASAAGCVTAQLLQGVADYKAILGACAGSTLAMVAQDVYALIQFYEGKRAAPAGAASLAQVGSGGPVPPELVAAWRKLYDDVRAELAK